MGGCFERECGKSDCSVKVNVKLILKLRVEFELGSIVMCELTFLEYTSMRVKHGSLSRVFLE